MHKKPIVKLDMITCTNHVQAPRTLQMQHKIPLDLYIALRNYRKVSVKSTVLQKEYINCIKKMLTIDKVHPDCYVYLFHILLFMEEFEEGKKMDKYTVKDQSLIRNKDETFSICTPSSLLDNDLISTQSRVKITEVHNNTIKCYAKILDIDDKKIVVSTNHKRFLDSFKSSATYNIKFLPGTWTYKCCHLALDNIRNSNATDFLYPVGGTFCEVQNFSIDHWFNLNVMRDEKQKQAVLNILNKTAFPAPYILFGPPGTGKTSTLVELICQVYENTLDVVLLCTPSNAAADVLVERLLKCSIPPNSIHRMYGCSKQWENVQNVIRPCSNFTRKQCIFLPKHLIASKRIVVATLTTSMRLKMLNIWSNHFSYIIIDEASQAIEPEMLIPITLALKCNNNELKSSIQAQLVIAGDPHQLGPVVSSQEAKHLLETSMLERLMKCKVYQKNETYNAKYITKLITNYRSHTAILHVPNKLFYDGELVAESTEETRRALHWQYLPNPTFPLIFCNVIGREEEDKNTMSKYNQDEIEVLMSYLRQLIGKKLGSVVLKQQDIGVVTPYKTQEIKIQAELRNRKWGEILVGTTEVFQGHEKDVIIISTVRSERIGFLSNYKRFNVAITRAKALLIIIGNATILRKDIYWNTLLEHCKKNGAVTVRDVIKCDQKSLDVRTDKKFILNKRCKKK